MLAALALTATAAMTMGSAAAAADTTADTNCTGYGIDNLLDAKSIKNRTTGTTVGSVQLCYRFVPSTGRWVAWTAVTLYYTMNSGDHANGAVRVRFSNTGEELSWSPELCSDAGGTGVIRAPDRTCASAGAFITSGLSYTGEAYVYNVNDIIIAAGHTDTIHFT